MSKEYNWRTDYDWTDPKDHPVSDNEFQPKVLKDQVVNFYKKPEVITINGRKSISYGVIDGPLFRRGAK